MSDLARLPPSARDSSMRWDEAVRAHLSFASKIYTTDEIQKLSAECGLVLKQDGANSASSYEDVIRYLHAVAKVCGETAHVSARLSIMNKARTLGLKASGQSWFR